MLSQRSLIDEEILESLLYLQLKQATAEGSDYSNEFIPVSELIERLKQSCAESFTHSAVLNIISRKLAAEKSGEEPWVEFQAYKGVRFTPRGLSLATSMLRKHRLAERLLVEILGFPIEEAHLEACRMEHSISDQVANRIEDKLGSDSSAACPHGLPIPTREGEIPTLQHRILSALEAPAEFILRGTMDESNEVFTEIHDLGLTLGITLQLKSNNPDSGYLTITLQTDSEEKDLVLPRSLASSLLIETID